MSKELNSLCVLRLSAIGDVCHAVAVVQAIQQQYPSCQITWVMGRVEAQLLHDLPNINVVVFDKTKGLQGVKEVWRLLRHQRFDVLLHMQVALRASLLSIGIRAKNRIGFSWKRAKEGQWLFTNRKLPFNESKHVLDNFADFARYLGVAFERPTWNIPLPEKVIAWARQQVSGPTLIICPSASKDERNWLSERYAAVVDYAISKQWQVILCGGPTERERLIAASIESYCSHPLINLVGKTSLKELAAILKCADIVLSPDSGPAHIATTQGTPVIGLYAHSNPDRTGPYNSLDSTVSVYRNIIEKQSGKTVECLPWGTRAKGEHLMESISVDSVIDSFDRLAKIYADDLGE